MLRCCHSRIHTEKNYEKNLLRFEPRTSEYKSSTILLHCPFQRMTLQCYVSAYSYAFAVTTTTSLHLYIRTVSNSITDCSIFLLELVQLWFCPRNPTPLPIQLCQRCKSSPVPPSRTKAFPVATGRQPHVPDAPARHLS
jgi:hypothetical protein